MATTPQNPAAPVSNSTNPVNSTTAIDGAQADGVQIAPNEFSTNETLNDGAIEETQTTEPELIETTQNEVSPEAPVAQDETLNTNEDDTVSEVSTLPEESNEVTTNEEPTSSLVEESTTPEIELPQIDLSTPEDETTNNQPIPPYESTEFNQNIDVPAESLDTTSTDNIQSSDTFENTEYNQNTETIPSETESQVTDSGLIDEQRLNQEVSLENQNEEISTTEPTTDTMIDPSAEPVVEQTTDITMDSAASESAPAAEELSTDSISTSDTSAQPEVTIQPEASSTDGSQPNVTPSEGIPNSELIIQNSAQDPFEGLNIVFDNTQAQAQTNTETPVSTESTTTSAEPAKDFVDPFVSSKETAPANTLDSIVATAAVEQTTEQTPNLDAMLADTTATTDASVQDEAATKKKKLLKIGSARVGVIILLAVSYLVFSTMFPTETNNLIEDLENNGSGTTVQTGDTQSPATSTGATSNDDELPTATEPTDTTNTTDNQLPSTNTSGFGEEDELPNVPTNTTTSTSTEDELPSRVEPDLSKASTAIEEQTSKAKQLLALAKEKNDTTSIRSIAAVIKTLKTIKEKVDAKSFTSYSTEIEGELSKTSFTLDQVAASLVQ